ncbi:hypothetical protein [Scytonema sp. NUACC26]|uniref:hypothetical protein n=1 Tax=Scytonema sp. NUACC26 TaxID=3140176 RepID=UPI0034DC74EE
MNSIVEVNEDGTLSLPKEILEAVKPHKRFAIEIRNGNLILSPQNLSEPFWATATPQERAEYLMQWVQSHRDGSNLPDEALRRENMYD